MAHEDALLSFVIKVWLEETAEESGRAVWRGRITHVASGRRQFIERTEEISAFIQPYLNEMGAEPSGRWRFRRWLRQWRAKAFGRDAGAAPTHK